MKVAPIFLFFFAVLCAVSVFEPAQAGTLRITPAPGGTLEPGGTVNLPARVAITPDEGYRVNWYELDGEIHYPGSRKKAQGLFVNVPEQSGFHVLRVDFAVNPAIMVIKNEVRGRGEIDLPDKMILPKGEWFRFSLDSSRGFHFSGLEIVRNATSAGETRTFLEADRYFQAVCNSGMTYCVSQEGGRRFPELLGGFSIFRWVFAPNPVISATHGIGGTIKPQGLVWAPYRSRQKFIITPEKGYVIKDVLVDEKSRGATTEITLHNIRKDGSIHAVFAPASP